MKIWILVGVVRGRICDVKIFRDSVNATQEKKVMEQEYSYPEMSGNDVGLYERKI